MGIVLIMLAYFVLIICLDFVGDQDEDNISLHLGGLLEPPLTSAK